MEVSLYCGLRFRWRKQSHTSARCSACLGPILPPGNPLASPKVLHQAPVQESSVPTDSWQLHHRALNPCPLQSHSRAHPRFVQSPLPNREPGPHLSRLSLDSSNTHPHPSISGGPGLSPHPISPSYRHFWAAATGDKVGTNSHQPWPYVRVRIHTASPAYHSHRRSE